ncbi:hypothetical protein [Flavobacterium coralii]|uniref:hypothetical protein n=1 Tax=Flavobacterium coralii TaxID=2838017 RepID=UPI000C4935AB|nr:hypothetical protein [Flavobacterium sp.]|tara:strand:- start:28942 stop:29292 length:351 start_codon:yes stop_codon:yes gene_type:complete
MDYNILAYVIFLSVIVYLIVVVGKVCYKNGNIFVIELLHGHEDLCIRINKILLTAYYLFNIGYAITTLSGWETVYTPPQLVESIAFKTALIVGILAIMHYLNILLLTKYVNKLINN